jgi:hypothetical protein
MPNQPSMSVRNCSPTAILPRPVNSPAATRHWNPEESFVRRPSCMMVKGGSSLVEAACVPKVGEAKSVKIEMVAELVAERVQPMKGRTENIAYLPVLASESATCYLGWISNSSRRTFVCVAVTFVKVRNPSHPRSKSRICLEGT